MSGRGDWEVKIIGESRNGYILEVSKDEVANLIGYSSQYNTKYKPLSVGDEVLVSKMFRQLYDLQNNQPELQKVVGTLRNLADLLEPICPVIEAQIKEAAK